MSPRKNTTPQVDLIAAQSIDHYGVYQYGRHHQITAITDVFTEAARLDDLTNGPLRHQRALEARAQELLERLAAGRQACANGTPWTEAVQPAAVEYCQVRAELEQWHRNAPVIEDETARLAAHRLRETVTAWSEHSRAWCRTLIEQIDRARLTRQPEPALPDGLTEDQARQIAGKAYHFDHTNPEAVYNSEGGWHDPEHTVGGHVYMTN